jgi:hypothetical protein
MSTMYQCSDQLLPQTLSLISDTGSMFLARGCRGYWLSASPVRTIMFAFTGDDIEQVWWNLHKISAQLVCFDLFLATSQKC